MKSVSKTMKGARSGKVESGSSGRGRVDFAVFVESQCPWWMQHSNTLDLQGWALDSRTTG